MIGRLVVQRKKRNPPAITQGAQSAALELALPRHTHKRSTCLGMKNHRRRMLHTSRIGNWHTRPLYGPRGRCRCRSTQSASSPTSSRTRPGCNLAVQMVQRCLGVYNLEHCSPACSHSQHHTRMLRTRRERCKLLRTHPQSCRGT